MDPVTLAGLLIRFGVAGTEIILKRIASVATIDDAIAACQDIRSAQSFVDADAAERGVTAVPLPG